MDVVTIQPSPKELLAFVGTNLRMVPEKYTGRRITGDGLCYPGRFQLSIGSQDRQPASTDIIWIVPFGAHVSSYQSDR